MEFHARDGAVLGFSLFGDPNAGARLALVHSLAMDRAFWRPVAERLANRACVLIYDCRGHGASSKPAGPYSVELFADDLADLFDHLGWARAVIGGASMGGSVALAFAQGHGARAAGLALFDTTAWYGERARQTWAERALKARREGLASLVEFQTTRWFSDGFRARNPQIVRACLDVFVANDPNAYAASCEMLGACDLRAGLGAIGAPTRILVGGEDYATPPAMAKALRAAIPGASLRVETGVRHLTPLEIPEIVAGEIRSLL